MQALETVSSALVQAVTARDVVDEIAGALDGLGASAAWLLTVDEPGQTLRTAAATGAGSEVVARHAPLPLAAPLPPAAVLRTGRPDFLATRADVRDRFPAMLDAVPGAGSVAVLPLTGAVQRLGVLGVSFSGERAFPAEDREYLAALGGIAALALARLRDPR